MAQREGFRPEIDYVSLAEFLRALAYPARLELLDVLCFPRSVGEVKLSPHRYRPGENPERPSARPTIQAHIDKLVEAGLVREEGVEVGGRALTRYVVNPQKLYSVTESLHRLSVRYAGRGSTGEATEPLNESVAAEEARGPRLVLVHGVYEGKAYRLDPKTAVDGRWVIGRKRGLPVSLDYDAYVSLENSVIERREDRFVVTDLPESKNGTFVNWGRVPRALPRALRSGDVVGVGRSLLVFVEAP